MLLLVVSLGRLLVVTSWSACQPNIWSRQYLCDVCVLMAECEEENLWINGGFLGWCEVDCTQLCSLQRQYVRCCVSWLVSVANNYSIGVLCPSVHSSVFVSPMNVSVEHKITRSSWCRSMVLLFWVFAVDQLSVTDHVSVAAAGIYGWTTWWLKILIL